MSFFFFAPNPLQRSSFSLSPREYLTCPLLTPRALTQSWNKKLNADIGRAMGAEFKKKGVNVLLGPVVGPLGRIATGGRNWEGEPEFWSGGPWQKKTCGVRSLC